MNFYKDLSDAVLVNLLKDGDEKALSALFNRYWDKMLVVACKRLDEPEEAEEIVQDIFFRLWQHRASLELRHSFATYLAVAVKYRVINKLDQLYRLHQRAEHAALYTDQFSPSPEEHILEQEMQQQIESSIKQLPEKCRIIFGMSRQQGLTYKQIAAELEISEKTVEAHMSKALKDIRSSLTITLPAVMMYLLEKDSFN